MELQLQDKNWDGMHAAVHKQYYYLLYSRMLSLIVVLCLISFVFGQFNSTLSSSLAPYNAAQSQISLWLSTAAYCGRYLIIIFPHIVYPKLLHVLLFEVTELLLRLFAGKDSYKTRTFKGPTAGFVVTDIISDAKTDIQVCK